MNFCEVILVEPSHGGNIGAVARAMNNMGLAKLRLVSPASYLGKEARTLAVHSVSILEEARVFDTLEDALSDLSVSIAFTARTREHFGQLSCVWELLDNVGGYEDVPLGLVFGRERTGLTNEEMSLCNRWVTIPTFGTNKSINLSHSVMIALYELSKLKNREKREGLGLPARSKEIEQLKKHLIQVLSKTDYFRRGNLEARKGAFSQLIGSKTLSPCDVKNLHGILSRIDSALDRTQKVPISSP